MTSAKYHSFSDIEKIFTDSLLKIKEATDLVMKDKKFDHDKMHEGWTLTEAIQQLKEVTQYLEEVNRKHYLG